MSKWYEEQLEIQRAALAVLRAELKDREMLLRNVLENIQICKRQLYREETK